MHNLPVKAVSIIASFAVLDDTVKFPNAAIASQVESFQVEAIPVVSIAVEPFCVVALLIKS